jgi:hypothetical protein
MQEGKILVKYIGYRYAIQFLSKSLDINFPQIIDGVAVSRKMCTVQ